MEERPPSRPVAIIDVGSNSIHLTLARVRGERIETMARLKDPARLAGALDRNLCLSPRSIERGVDTLRRFRELAAVQGAEVRATGTAALRAARNGGEFLRRAIEEAGVHVELITGNEEARLTYAGVQHGMPRLRDARIFCVDVGGGSTEFACGRGAVPALTASVPVGSAVVARHLLGPDPISRKTVRRARQKLERQLEDRMAAVHRFGFEYAVATSGTIQLVTQIARTLNGRSGNSRDVHGQPLATADIDAVVERLSIAPTHSQRLCVPGMDPERADTLLGGALIFQVLSRGLDIREWVVSMAALRTGLIMDTVRRREHPVP